MPTKIEWTNETWNPVTGCTKVSPGCANCYAERMARRLAGRAGYPEKPDHFDVTVHGDRLSQPYRWNTPRRVFVCSMGDLFHEYVSRARLADFWGAMVDNRQHTYQVLTKRPKRMAQWAESANAAFGPTPHIWLGVSAENQEFASLRIPILLQTPAAVRFVSAEPLLGPLDLTRLDAGILPGHKGYMANTLDTKIGPSGKPHKHLDWVIIGCESGPGRRPMELDWAVDLVSQCKAAGVPVFVKQLDLDGKVSKNPAEWPEELRVREYPKI